MNPGHDPGEKVGEGKVLKAAPYYLVIIVMGLVGRVG